MNRIKKFFTNPDIALGFLLGSVVSSSVLTLFRLIS